MHERVAWEADFVDKPADLKRSIVVLQALLVPPELVEGPARGTARARDLRQVATPLGDAKALEFDLQSPFEIPADSLDGPERRQRARQGTGFGDFRRQVDRLVHVDDRLRERPLVFL